ncbi:MAG: glycosyltransferase family 2 protein [Cycloclasticus sp.]|uniref:glycosyltransferase family 2 protein n=1 Tax=Cycloclasticus sp. TaxID=2024830 RepID=UPI00257C6279|nr:glycosyltransferase family 2 protein [Cycloclasticus sp.]MBV1898682.1 glycosyltransferase family 2 protein [Cycloclasticus sp.]
MRDFLNDVIPVVVTYNAEIKVLDDLLNSLQLFDKVQLVDNGSNSVAELKELCSKYANLAASFLPANVGLAEAQNLAVDSITTNDACTFIILFDQDSVPVENCIEVLYNYANQLKSEGIKLGAIGPALVDSFLDSRFGFIKNGKRFYKEEAENNIFECDGINSSGSLIPLGVWQDLGGNNSSLFIDHVETDWCFRARAAGYECYGTFDALLSHSMGESTIKYWFFGWRTMPDRTPERHYYLFRNSIFLQQQSYVPISWKYKNILKLILTIGYFGVFHRQRVKHISNMYIGLKDGINKRLGVKK